MPSPRDCEPQLFTQLELAEREAQRDMQVRGVRLSKFVAEREGKEWQEQPNGEWWLVPVTQG